MKYLETAVATLDWSRIRKDLDAQGWAHIEGVLDAQICESVAAVYGRDEFFRSRVVMQRHGFGRGEYRYYAYPLPDMVSYLRETLYPPLSEIANRWIRQLAAKDPRVLPQRIYRLEHNGLGELDIFLVPIGKDADGVSYQAMFN